MKLALVGILSLISFSLFAQSVSILPSTAGTDTIPAEQKQSPWNMSFQAGASVGSFNGHTFTTSFVAPTVNYSLNDNLSLFGGISYMKAFLPMTVLPVLDINNQMNFGSMNGIGTYAGLAYQLNPRLTMYGAVYGTSFTSPTSLDHNFGKIEPGYTVGFEYKSSENFSFGVEISRTSGYNPLYNPVVFPNNHRMHPMRW